MSLAVSLELVLLCASYPIGLLFFGGLRMVSYPLLAASVLFNLFYAQRLSPASGDGCDYALTMLFTLLLLIGTSFSMIYQGRLGFDDGLIQLGMIVLGVLFARQILVWYSFSWAMWIGYMALVFYLSFRASLVPQEHIRGLFFGGKTTVNGLSAILIWCEMFLCLGMLRAKVFVKGIWILIPPLATALLCAYLGGRSGTIFSVLFLGGVMISLGLRSKMPLSRLVPIIAIVVAALCLAINASSFSDLAIFKNFETGGLESEGRATVVVEYVAQLANPLNILFGVDLQSLDIISWIVHPHNSYIRLHSYMGLLGFLAVVSTLIFGILRTSRGDFGVLLMLMAFPLKAMLDSMCFFTFSDFALYVFCLSAFCSNNLVFGSKALSWRGNHEEFAISKSIKANV